MFASSPINIHLNILINIQHGEFPIVKICRNQIRSNKFCSNLEITNDQALKSRVHKRKSTCEIVLP